MQPLATLAKSGTPAALKQVSALAKNAVNAVHQEYKFTFENHCCHITKLRPDILVVDFPDKERRHWLALQLNREFAGEYLVLNLSGEAYDTSEFQGPVMDIVTMSRTVLPLEVLMRLCVSAHRWLVSGKSDDNGPRRSLVLHGGPMGFASGPLPVLLACYLSWAGAAAASLDAPPLHPKEALIEVCQALGISEKSASPSQRRYLSYFELLQHGFLEMLVGDSHAEVATLQLSRIALVGIGGDGRQRILQVWQQDRKIFEASLDSCCDIAGSAVPIGLQCRGDLSVQILQTTEVPEGSRAKEELEMQVCFHTAFINDGFIRFSEPEIEVFCAGEIKGCTIDIFFDPAIAAELEDAREAASVASAAAAVASGPTAVAEAVLVQPEDCSATDVEPIAAPEAWNSTSAVGMFVDLAANDTSPVKTVFVADDIDRFFADL